MKNNVSNNRIIFGLLITLIMYISICSAQDNPQDAKKVMLRHKQYIYNQAKLLNTADIRVNENQRQFDAKYYKLEMEISYVPQAINAGVTAVLSSLTDNLNTIELDLENALTVDSVAGAAVSFSRENDLVVLTLDRPYDNGEQITVQVFYSGLPNQVYDRNFKFDTMPSGSPMVWTLSEPYGARYWWPCKDSPADKADSVDLIITAPRGQLVGSNGTLISDQMNNDGTRTFHWHEQYPIATYLVSLVVGDYAHFQEYYHYGEQDSMLLDYYVYPEELETAQSIFAEMQDYLDALSYYFGPYPFLKEKYGQARYNWGGAMEHQTLTSIGLVNPVWRYVYVHELGHQWFGDLVTCASWSDIWLNEGFASYSEALYAEWAGYDSLPPGMDAYHAYIATQDFRGDGTIFIYDTTEVSNIFGRIVYDKGSWVLHMLRGIMGDEVFFNVLKTYAHDIRWTYGSVRTENFQEICEQLSGLDLDTFFNQWLYHPYYPEYKYSWDSDVTKEGNHAVELVIEQIQNSIAYEMPVELLFEFANGTDTSVVVNNKKYVQYYSFTFRQEPVRLIFDPDNWILKSAVEGFLEPFTDHVRISKIGPNPFPSGGANNIKIELLNWVETELVIDIFDVLGRKVISLPVEQTNPYTSRASWDGTSQNGYKVSSGMYFLRIRDKNNHAIKFSGTRKIIYMNNK
ncbi:MAG: M1 family aminopeptidase [Calditrichaceae bacterium]